MIFEVGHGLSVQISREADSLINTRRYESVFLHFIHLTKNKYLFINKFGFIEDLKMYVRGIDRFGNFDVILDSDKNLLS